jgi:hypothetical protein
MIQILFFFLAAVMCVLAWVDWRGLFRKFWGTNPAKGVIFMKCGSDIEPVKARRTYMADDGQYYEYKWQGMELAVVVPKDYPYNYFEGARIIAVTEGQIHAAPFEIHGVKCSDGVCDVSAITQGMVTVELVKALSEKGGHKWLMYLLIGAAVIAAIVVFNMMKGGGDEVPAGPVNSNTAPESTPAEEIPEEYQPWLPHTEIWEVFNAW